MINKPWFLLLAIFLGAAALMLATAPLVESSAQESFAEPDHLDRPLLPEMVARAGQHHTPGALPYLVRYRFFPCVLFAAAVAGTFLRMRTLYPASVAWVAVVALLTMPRLFAAAHTATNASIAGSCLLLCWAVSPWATRSLIGILAWITFGAASVAAALPAIAVLPLTVTGVFSQEAATRRRSLQALVIGYFAVASIFGLYLAVLKFDSDFTRSTFLSLQVTSGAEWLSVRALGRELLACPEWHLIFALVALVFGLRRYAEDTERFALAVLGISAALLLEEPTRLIFVGPLAALGVGRLLYRGTLNKPFRIPAANWAIVLLAVAAFRTGVIMVSWAPQWQNYHNRIGLMVEAPRGHF